MRRSAKVDSNQSEIVAALRKAGAHVQSLAAIGKGCPDLLVSHRGRWHAMEIKDPAKPPSARKLTEDQVAWHREAQGPVWVVTTPEEAIMCLWEPGEDDWK
jgi:hypothetical protein